ncbi:MAG: hypothetical protein PHQ23_10730, partial [Candidatus Wallbacteria bacterium]|nr:hypothetical protein [Candidatus Wallbacteria bacterium]
MKSLVKLLCCALIVFFFSSAANSTGKNQPDQGQKRPGNPGGPRGGAENIVDQLEELGERLNLTEDQEIKLTPFINNYGESLRKIMEENADATPEQKREAMGKLVVLREQLIKDMSSVLNQEQQQKLQEYFAERQKRGQGIPVEKTMEILKEELDLSPEQIEQMTSVLEEQSEELQPLHQEMI